MSHEFTPLLAEKVNMAYRPFESIEDVLRQIGEQYECTEREAVLILIGALGLAIQGGNVPRLYFRSRLRPRQVGEQEWGHVAEMLRETDETGTFSLPACLAFRRHLCEREDVRRLMDQADYPLALDDSSTIPEDVHLTGAGGDDVSQSVMDTEEDTIEGLKATIEDLKVRLAEAEAENERPTHLGGMLPFAIEAQPKYWDDYSRGTNRIPPKRETTIPELMDEYGLTRNEAGALEGVMALNYLERRKRGARNPK